MPLGGVNAGFDESVPADSENAGLGAQRIRSLETTLQQVLDSEHNFPASGGPNTGYHRLGSARVFVGTQSTVSSAGTDGRLQVTSDTSRLFHVGSGGTMLLGGATSVLVAGGGAALDQPQRTYWAEEWGQVGNAGSSQAVSFTSAYSGIPTVTFSLQSAGNGSSIGLLGWLSTVGTAGFTLEARQYVAGVLGVASHHTILWRSLGSRLF